MSKNNIIKKAMLNAVGTVAYIVVVASFMFYMPKSFGPLQKETVLVPITVLSLLVLSVASVGLLIFGRPILWYWDGQKKEAIALLTYTLITFLVITLFVLAILFLM